VSDKFVEWLVYRYSRSQYTDWQVDDTRSTCNSSITQRTKQLSAKIQKNWSYRMLGPEKRVNEEGLIDISGFKSLFKWFSCAKDLLSLWKSAFEALRMPMNG
jgi:hypothetical protein